MIELNPVLVKELRGRMRGIRAFILLTIYLVILGGVTLLLYVAMTSSSGTDLNAGRRVGQALFYVIAAVALIEVCIITPSLTAGGIAGEKERQTYDLLISSQLSPWQIVWGKLGSALAFAMLLVLAVVPMMSLAFLFGGVGLAQLLIALAGLVATAVCYACVGLFWSTVMRSTLGANSFALGSIIMLLLGIPFLAIIFSIIFQPNFNDLMDSALFIYAAGTFLSAHPFIALGLSEAFIREGDSPFWASIPRTTAGELLVPSPWIGYILLSLLFSAIMVLLSVRMIRPVTYGQGRESGRKGKRGRDQEE